MGGPADDPAVLDEARRRCQRLLDQLRHDARELERPSRLISEDALAEGRRAYDRAAAAAEELLRRLDESPHPQ